MPPLFSYDNGATWIKLGEAKGGPGDSIFQSVTQDDSFYYFTLANGEIIRLGRGIAGVKAITAVPDFSNGAVSASKDLFTIRFAVVPEEAAENIASLSTDIYKLSVVYTNLTKASAGDEVELNVVSQEALGGKLLLTVDGSVLDDKFIYAQLGANAMLSVVYNENAMTSGFFPLKLKKNYIEVYAGDDLQQAIDNAPEGADIRVEAGAEFDGPIFIWKNLRLSGGWVDDFSRQNLRKRSVIDGHDMKRCMYSGIDKEGNRPALDNVVLSGFELRNGYGSGVFLHGRLTVEYCWIHNCFNSDKGGAIMATEESGDELFLANSILEYNKADAHGGAVAMAGQGTKITVVNCLFRGNASIAQYGYTGVIHGPALTTGEASDLVLEILGPYTTDLDGNPRIVGGKITAGCYQPQ